MIHSALALFAQRTRIPTSARSIGFCVIWVCISSSSSSIYIIYISLTPIYPLAVSFSPLHYIYPSIQFAFRYTWLYWNILSHYTWANLLVYSKLYTVAHPTNFVDRGAALPAPLQLIQLDHSIGTYAQRRRSDNWLRDIRFIQSNVKWGASSKQEGHEWRAQAVYQIHEEQERTLDWPAESTTTNAWSKMATTINHGLPTELRGILILTDNFLMFLSGVSWGVNSEARKGCPVAPVLHADFIWCW